MQQAAGATVPEKLQEACLFSEPELKAQVHCCPLLTFHIFDFSETVV